MRGLSGLRLGAPDSVFETTRTCVFVANGHCVSVRSAVPLTCHFALGFRPRSPSEGVRGGLQLALDRSTNLAVHPSFADVTRSNPFLPSNQSFRAALLVRFRLVTRSKKFRARCPRSAFEPARAPPVARERDEEWRGFTPHHPPGRAFLSPTCCERCLFAKCLRAEPWIPRRLRLSSQV